MAINCEYFEWTPKQLQFYSHKAFQVQSAQSQAYCSAPISFSFTCSCSTKKNKITSIDSFSPISRGWLQKLQTIRLLFIFQFFLFFSGLINCLSVYTIPTQSIQIPCYIQCMKNVRFNKKPFVASHWNTTYILVYFAVWVYHGCVDHGQHNISNRFKKWQNHVGYFPFLAH